MHLGLLCYYTCSQEKEKPISTLIFLWLQNQTFYSVLQKKALEPVGSRVDAKTWADIGCSTGLMTRLAQSLNYRVIGYDVNSFSLLVANILSFHLKNISYEKEDFHELSSTFDVVSATSLLSVMDEKEEALQVLISLLKESESTLILIEPTEKLTVKSVKDLMHDFKTFWYYKGLLVWAYAREDKATLKTIFDGLEGVNVSHLYTLHDMVRISTIKKRYNDKKCR